ncbi:MAG: hypothetical protein HGA96_03075 [Desulfobulbaceae bacterium]|nr:hypothetical protein [Desulfobulbaceae bacterium]
MDPKETTRVAIFTRDFKITGYIGLMPGVRLTDYMVETKQFIAVTNAEVTALGGDGTTIAEGFLDVNRDTIQFVKPVG